MSENQRTFTLAITQTDAGWQVIGIEQVGRGVESYAVAGSEIRTFSKFDDAIEYAIGIARSMQHGEKLRGQK